MKVAAIAVGCTITAAVMVGAVRANAAPLFFQSPSGNISCQLYWFETATASVGCQVRDYTFAAPPHPTNCQGGWGDSIGLVQGQPAKFDCHSSTLFGGNPAILPYGGTQSLGAITCDSEPAGMTCKDASSGHFFYLSRDSYRLG
jgi:hypothetical protein